MSSSLPATMTVCPSCGAPAGPEARYCNACGTHLQESTLLPNQPLRLELLFSREGRIGRLEYFLSGLVLTVMWTVALGLTSALTGNLFGVFLGLLLVAAASLALVCAGSKRLHDAAMSDRIAVVGFIPLVNWIFLIVLSLIGPSQGSNRYGVEHSGTIRQASPAPLPDIRQGEEAGASDFRIQS